MCPDSTEANFVKKNKQIVKSITALLSLRGTVGQTNLFAVLVHLISLGFSDFE